MAKKVEAVKAWGAEYATGKLEPVAKIVKFPGAMCVRVIREGDYRRLLAAARNSRPKRGRK